MMVVVVFVCFCCRCFCEFMKFNECQLYSYGNCWEDENCFYWKNPPIFAHELDV